MNTRLVWNFEITQDTLLDFKILKEEDEKLRWEARYFWPGDAIICLNGLDKQCLALSNYKTKHRQDCYALLAGLNCNIKQRRMQWLYKPLLATTEHLNGYGKKINLAEYPANEILPGNEGLRASDLLSRLATSKNNIELTKEVLIYKFPSEPTTKLELARLEIKEKIYFSLCIEGHSQRLVSSIAKHLLGMQISCDYISFLKQTYTL